MDGMRACLKEDCKSIYVINMRGDVRKSMSGVSDNKTEGDNIFGQGCSSGISIAFFVAGKEKSKDCKIYYKDVSEHGESLSTNQKLQIIARYASLDLINFTEVTPDNENNWINTGSAEYKKFLDTDDKKNGVFRLRSNGIVTARDAYVINSSKKELSNNVKKTIDFYNSVVEQAKNENITKENVDEILRKYGAFNDPRLKWASDFKNYFIKKIKLTFDENKIRLAAYRPFFKQWMYYDKALNHRHFQQNKVFKNKHTINKSIVVSRDQEFNCFAVDKVPSDCFIFHSQSIPHEIYHDGVGALADKSTRESSVDSKHLDQIRVFFGESKIDANAVYHYTYGILHSPEYRKKFKLDLLKSAPKIPIVNNLRDFEKISNMGKELLDLHLNYEKAPKYNGIKVEIKNKNFKVQKMKWLNDEKTALQYNDDIVISNIPPKAHNYKINGQSALWWLVNRYKVTHDEKTGIRNDPNEFFDDSKEILDLIQRVVYVSMKTQEIQEKLPKLEVDMDYYCEKINNSLVKTSAPQKFSVKKDSLEK